MLIGRRARNNKKKILTFCYSVMTTRRDNLEDPRMYFLI